jgi:hypothetical protein
LSAARVVRRRLTETVLVCVLMADAAQVVAQLEKEVI